MLRRDDNLGRDESRVAPPCHVRKSHFPAPQCDLPADQLRTWGFVKMGCCPTIQALICHSAYVELPRVNHFPAVMQLPSSGDRPETGGWGPPGMGNQLFRVNDRDA